MGGAGSPKRRTVTMPTTRHSQTEAPERRLHPSPPADWDNGRRSRRTRWLVALGFTLLAASAIGTGVALRSHAHDGKTPETPPPADVAVAYGFGHVDVEERVIESLYPRLLDGPNKVEKVLVHENDLVKKGDPILRLESRQAHFAVQRAEVDLKDAELRLAQAKAAIPQHESMIKAKEKDVEAYKEGLNRARLMFKEAERMYAASKEARLISKEKVDIAEAAVKEADKKVEAAQAEVEVLKEKRESLKIAVDRAREDVAAKKIQLNQAKYAEEQCELKAPMDGKVLRLLVTEGQLLGPQPSGPLLYFCPDTPRIIRAEIDQEFAGLVQPGQPVTITDDATLAASIRGKVKRTSDWFAPKRSPLMEPRQLNDVRTLECIVEVDPARSKELRIGQRVRVKIEKK